MIQELIQQIRQARPIVVIAPRMRYEKIVDAIVHGFFPTPERSLLAHHDVRHNDRTTITVRRIAEASGSPRLCLAPAFRRSFAAIANPPAVRSVRMTPHRGSSRWTASA